MKRTVNTLCMKTEYKKYGMIDNLNKTKKKYITQRKKSQGALF